jgi:hypothetical protein
MSAIFLSRYDSIQDEEFEQKHAKLAKVLAANTPQARE